MTVTDADVPAVPSQRGWSGPVMIVVIALFARLLLGPVVDVGRNFVQFVRWEARPDVSVTLDRTPMPPAPLSPRNKPAGVWTGSRFIVWGGVAPGPNPRDGAAYDPVAQTWTSIADSPLSGRRDHSAVWSGTEMIVWGGQNDGGMLSDGAAYDPATDTWRRIATAPEPDRYLPDAFWWDGRMVLLGQPAIDGRDGSSTVLLYDPAADDWQVLRVKGHAMSATVVQGRLVVAGIQRGGVWLGTLAPGEDTLELRPDPGLRPGAESVSVVDTGDRLSLLATYWNDTTLVATQAVGDLAADPVWPAQRWPVVDVAGDVPAPHADPMELGRGIAVPLANGVAGLFTDWTNYAVHPTTGAVTRLDYSMLCAATVWTGSQLLTWGGIVSTDAGDDECDGVAYTPTVTEAP